MLYFFFYFHFPRPITIKFKTETLFQILMNDGIIFRVL